MRGGTALLVLLTALPLDAAANTMIIAFHSASDDINNRSCSLHLSGGRFSMAQIRGSDMQSPEPFAWWASAREEAAFLRALSPFVAGDYASLGLDDADPPPPYIEVTWFVSGDGSILTGRYQAEGSTLPREVQALLETVVPGSYCGAGFIP